MGISFRASTPQVPSSAQPDSVGHGRRQPSARRNDLPQAALLTVDDVAGVLRTGRKAIYAMVEHRQLPGVIRVRRRVLIRRNDLLDWLDQKRAPSPEE